jgi:hypothetical protein
MATRKLVSTDPGGAVARALTFVYGVGTYLFFLSTFLYLIGFVGNWIVPKDIDDGPLPESTGTAIAVNVRRILVAVFVEAYEDEIRILSARRATGRERRRYGSGEKD